jgi:hypothetical protein
MQAPRTLMILPDNSIIVVDDGLSDKCNAPTIPDKSVKPASNRKAGRERATLVKKYRETLGLNKKQVAELMGMSIGVYNAREKGTGNFTDQQFKMIEIKYIEYRKNLSQLKELMNEYFESCSRNRKGTFHKLWKALKDKK